MFEFLVHIELLFSLGMPVQYLWHIYAKKLLIADLKFKIS